MTATKYHDRIREVLTSFDPEGQNRYFLFGSAVRGKLFHDIDLGVVGNGTSRKKLSDLRDRFYDSLIPYKVDVVDFDEADRDFNEYVRSNEPIVWLR